jgi:ATP-dependent Lhr-like helicase
MSRQKESRVFAWFRAKYGQPTPAQREAWPHIQAGRHVLIASPTGTGKTFAAFLSVLDTLEREHAAGGLRDTLQCIYVSPLRALSYDLEKNLQLPLQELFGEKPPIRVELRSGDTGSYQRARQVAKPPHILLTTPESLCLLLSQERWVHHLANARWLILDEIHALAGNKRGAHLSLSIERLAEIVDRRSESQTATRVPALLAEGAPQSRQRVEKSGVEAALPALRGNQKDCREVRGVPPPSSRRGKAAGGVEPEVAAEKLPGKPEAPLQRVGLSATIAPLTRAAQYLVGTQGHCEIIDATAKKRIELGVYTPLRKDPYPPSGYTGERLVKELGGLVQKHRTTLVFCNTRSGAEATTFWLREKMPALAEQIECHHASLERDVRRGVEDRLKRGELRAVVCSTSLELGIDIGSVDLVVMLATPKGVSRALQRAGRAGHNIHSVSRGLLMATNLSDLVEACATVRLARAQKLDEIKIPSAPLDVLAQQLVSMGCTRRWTRADALELVRRALPYSELGDDEFEEVLNYLAGGGKALRRQYAEVFGRIVLDDDGFETRGGRIRQEFLQNIGTIPDVASVRIRLKTQNLGSVEESFARTLKIGDVFIMAGRPVRLEKISQMDGWVTRADGATPTVPRWNAAKMPLSNRVCEEIIAFRGELRERMERGEPGHAEWIRARLDCGKANAELIRAMYAAQHTLSEIPTADFLLIEEHLERAQDHLDEAEKKKPRPAVPRAVARHYFFHSLIGRAANDALARVVSYRLSKLRGGNALATPHDYGFVLTLTPGQQFSVAEAAELLSPRLFDDDLQAALAESEMVKYHFRNAAQTGLMIYRNYFDERKPVRKMQWSAEVIFNVLQQHEPDHILLREARRESLHTYVDVDGARAYVNAPASRNIRLHTVPIVPPLSFAMYATKIKEALLVEDPYETMERLYHLWWGQIEEQRSKAAGENVTGPPPTSPHSPAAS